MFTRTVGALLTPPSLLGARLLPRPTASQVIPAHLAGLAGRDRRSPGKTDGQQSKSPGLQKALRDETPGSAWHSLWHSLFPSRRSALPPVGHEPPVLQHRRQLEKTSHTSSLSVPKHTVRSSESERQGVGKLSNPSSSLWVVNDTSPETGLTSRTDPILRAGGRSGQGAEGQGLPAPSVLRWAPEPPAFGSRYLWAASCSLGGCLALR